MGSGMREIGPPKREDHHRAHFMNGDIDEIILVAGGKSAYLWIGREKASPSVFSGAKSLRRLARAILAEVPDA
jgi:hypothetical protein